MEVLNKNFNSMISRLKNQQEKLIINERYKAWGNLSRKLAHEIKNPLTPIQLTIDRIRTKYTGQITNEDQQSFCLLYTSPSPRDAHESRMPSSA